MSKITRTGHLPTAANIEHFVNCDSNCKRSPCCWVVVVQSKENIKVIAYHPLFQECSICQIICTYVHRYGGFEWCWDAHIWRNTTKTNGTRVFPIWPCHLPVLVDRVAPLLKHLSQTQCGSMLMNVYGQGIHVDSSCLIWMFDLDLSQGLLVQKWPLNSECESFKVTIARGYKASDPKQVWGSSPSKDAAPHDGYSHDAFSSIYTKFHHGGLDLFRGYYTAYIFKMQ